MIYKVFSVYDTKAEAFLRPFVVQTLGVVKRSFGEAMQDPRHEFAKYPNDYLCWEVGTFDDETGEVMPIQPVNHGLVSVMCREYTQVSYSETPEASSDEVSDAAPIQSGAKRGNSEKHV